MNDQINFHSTQLEAIDFLVDGIIENKSIIGLVGAGGTGKSEILSALPRAYYNALDGKEGKSLFFSATTNKAVSRLLEVLPDANTVHSLTTKPNYTKLYNELDAFFALFKEVDESKRKDYANNHLFSAITNRFISEKYIVLDKHRSLADMLAYLSMSSFSKEMFKGYTVKEEEEYSVLIVDEASMLPTNSEYYEGSLITVGLDVAQRVFGTIILVGDSSQLPPVNGHSSFDHIESYELTKNFRSEVDLLDAIQHAREGKWFGKFKSDSKNVRIVDSITDKWYESTFQRNDVAHIVYRNKTRHEITKKIRKDQGKNPTIGEPIMLRGRGFNQIQKGEIGVFNGKVVEFENGEVKLGKWDNFDEYVTDKYGKYQYGYAITCHLAQGSAFDHVIVHAYDIPHFLTKEEKRKWLYTAVSRARKSLTIIL